MSKKKRRVKEKVCNTIHKQSHSFTEDRGLFGDIPENLFLSLF